MESELSSIHLELYYVVPFLVPSGRGWAASKYLWDAVSPLFLDRLGGNPVPGENIDVDDPGVLEL